MRLSCGLYEGLYLIGLGLGMVSFSFNLKYILPEFAEAILVVVLKTTLFIRDMTDRIDGFV